MARKIRTWETNADEFALLDTGEGWPFAALVATSVEKGKGNGRPPKTSAIVEVSGKISAALDSESTRAYEERAAEVRTDSAKPTRRLRDTSDLAEVRRLGGFRKEVKPKTRKAYRVGDE